MECAGYAAPLPERVRMSRTKWRRIAARPLRGALLSALLATLSVDAGAQGATSLKRTLPGPGGASCPAAGARPATPSDAQRRQARQIAARGQQASIVDDYNSARDLYKQAAQLDPTDANTAYYLARAQEAVKNPREAVKEYCRFLTLTPTAPEAAEARDRIVALGAPGAGAVSEQAAAQFRAGLDQFERGRVPEAVTAFSNTITQASDWPDPYYNRGIAYQTEGRRNPAIKDFEKYLQLRPEADDRSAVVARIDGLRRGMVEPSGALTRGLVIPGFGQYYTRRPVLGALVLAGVGGSVFYAMQQSQVRTSTVKTAIDAFGKTEYQYTVVSIRNERPHLTTGLAVAAGITVGAAIEAYFRARGEREDAPKPAATTRTSSAGVTPLLAPAGSGFVLGLQLALPRSR